MEVVRELRRKQDDLKADRKALVDQIAEIDRKIAAIDTVIQVYEPGHSPRKAAAQRAGKRGQFLGGLFAEDNLSARILDTLRLAHTPISLHECAICEFRRSRPPFRNEAGRAFRSEAGHPWRRSHGSIS